ncbi:putative bifunctional diguanylate cyclase/phosphodiesterase [Sphingomicrobium marinum]|uniref:putative bifunctional diguanylate cyclase/phosphodiesterase n=1 Tax=Sphingomicrobium marinum TaxID=1227950 RepID=UPI00223F090C|nr:bifunctional diguanylate cyclase/phosphodiesterase [Sphingomicrobium marinum]
MQTKPIDLAFETTDRVPGGARVAFAHEMRMLEALPMAAAIVGLNGDKLWVHALNETFRNTVLTFDLEEKEVQVFQRHAAGEMGTFFRAFLADPMNAPDQMDSEDGEGLSRRYFTLKLAPLGPHSDGSPRCLVSLVDRTVEMRAEKHLRDEMLRDSLTGLPNRLSFTESIEQAEGDHAVLVVDMLRFSRINESMGTMAGDELLITLARRLMGALRSGDILARTGGNEFAVLVRLNKGREDALKAAHRIENALVDPFRLSELEIRVDCAIGIAMLDRDSVGEELFRNAQFAVKQAKAVGRPTVYAPSEASAARHRFSIETELRRALDREEVELAFQPLIDLKTGLVTGFEALSRWTHEERGPISPSEFIPVAEESGLILDLGRFVMEKSAATLAEWDERAGETLPLYVGVNLSAIQLQRDDISDVVGSALRAHNIGGERLTLELTESAIVQDPARAGQVFERLKGLDATLAMDDFGTGYSSLAYLQRLPIDVLKIDRSFVTGMLKDADNIAIVRAILGLADALGMKTTAEGIENVELATTLATLGCDNGQGYFFAKPLKADDAFAYWQQRKKAGGLLG